MRLVKGVRLIGIQRLLIDEFRAVNEIILIAGSVPGKLDREQAVDFSEHTGGRGAEHFDHFVAVPSLSHLIAEFPKDDVPYHFCVPFRFPGNLL